MSRHSLSFPSRAELTWCPADACRLLLGGSKAGSFILDRVLVLVSLISDDDEEDAAKREAHSPVFAIT